MGYELQRMNFRDIVEELPNTEEKLTSLLFHKRFLKSQKWLWEQYLNLWNALGVDFSSGTKNSPYVTHTFLYYGNKYFTALHAAAAEDYQLQVANAKKWRFLHKRYLPYVTSFRRVALGVAE